MLYPPSHHEKVQRKCHESNEGAFIEASAGISGEAILFA
jgi:hypothetical protein